MLPFIIYFDYRLGIYLGGLFPKHIRIIMIVVTQASWTSYLLLLYNSANSLRNNSFQLSHCWSETETDAQCDKLSTYPELLAGTAMKVLVKARKESRDFPSTAMRTAAMAP